MIILYIAQSCDPYNGSEDAIGWNVPLQASIDGNDVCVITRTEKKPIIDKWIEENKDRYLKIPEFYYVDIPNIYKKLCKGFLYSGRLNVWHRKALPIAKEICKNKKIEIIHQITPIEFRAIGNYYEIPDTKFVVGPIGGGSYIHKGFYKYVSIKNRLIEYIRKVINKVTRKSINKKIIIKKIDSIIYSNKEIMQLIEGYYDPQKIFVELGIKKEFLKDEFEAGNKIKNDKVNFLLPGRLVYIKGHRFLIDTIKDMPREYDFKINIVGDGPDYKLLNKLIISDEYLKSHISLIGFVPFVEIKKMYESNDVVLVSSLRENCATVMLEGYANGLPVIALKKFGASHFINEECGRFFNGETNEELKESLRNALIYFIENKEKLSLMEPKCIYEAKKYLWENKNKYYYKIYDELLSDNN